MADPRIFDQQGQEHDWVWLVTNLGAINLERAESTTGRVFRVVKLQDAEGSALQIVQVADQDGKPLVGVNVVRWWPDAPNLPAWGAEVSQWRTCGVYGPTDDSGDIGFGMGHGDYYLPPAGGASGVWVADSKGLSDFVSGLGMLGGTNHRHVDVFYQLVELNAEPRPEPQPEPESEPEPEPEPQPEPEPEPPADPWPALFEKLDRIVALLEKQAG
jgi:hypothetical protein